MQFIVFIAFCIAFFFLFKRITKLEKRIDAILREELRPFEHNENNLDAEDQNIVSEPETVYAQYREDEPVKKKIASITQKNQTSIDEEQQIEAANSEDIDSYSKDIDSYSEDITREPIYSAAKSNDNFADYDIASLASEDPQKAGFNIDFEEFFGRRLPIWAGGITLAIAGILIAKYASDNGYLSAQVKIIFGFLFGGGLIAVAEVAFRKEDWVRDARVRQALSGAGIATLYAAIFVGHNVYDIFGPLSAFIGMAMVTAGALGLSLRFGAPSAVLGLIGGLVTPALIDSSEPNIPMLTLYLALTIGGLTAISKSQKWAWLGISALIGGTGWALILIATSALDFATSLSVGALIMLLALLLPFFTYAGALNSVLRLVSIIVGSGQLALLVAKGGFEPLQWAIFCLMALGAQFVAHRESRFDVVRSISLCISAVLLLIWPDPDIIIFAIVGIILLLIHALPLMRLLWQDKEDKESGEEDAALEKLFIAGRYHMAIEIALMSIAVFAITMWHYYYNGSFIISDLGWSIIAIGGASVSAIAIAKGWNAKRDTDNSFALLSATCTALLCIAYFIIAPLWTHPLGMAFFATALLLFGHKAADMRLEKISVLFAFVALPLLLLSDTTLVLSGGNIGQEFSRLYEGSDGNWDIYALMRWGGLGAIFSFLAYKIGDSFLKTIMQGIATFLLYGLLAQFIVNDYLPFTLAIIACGLAAHRFAWPTLAPALVVVSLLVINWAAQPLVFWSITAVKSLIGIPMVLENTLFSFHYIMAYLMVPALLMAVAIYIARAKLPSHIALVASLLTAIAAFVGLHSLYKIAFSTFIGSDFVRYALLERIIWGAMLIATGWAISRFFAANKVAHYFAAGLIGSAVAHGLYYSIILHNPLIVQQMVGPWPVANLIIPTFGLIIVGAELLKRIIPDLWNKYDYYWQFILMALVSIFAYTMLRQFFHGSILSISGFETAEDITRSILAIVLAIGYLLWGIKSKQRNWRVASLFLMLGAVGKVFLFDAAGLDGLLRIASFVALGISLIGIGWLYSRQVRSNNSAA